jgi:uncharacterized protein YjhX (UPF0386 family)
MEVNESLDSNHCLICGGRIEKKNNNKFRCTACGETYDIEEFETFELDLTVLDKILLHSLKKRRAGQKNRNYQYEDHLQSYNQY